MKPREALLTDGLNGLNWHVHVDPVSLAMTSFPPTVALVEVDDLDDELPPQAVTSMPTAANNMTHLKRFIDILRSRFRRSPAGPWLRLCAARHPCGPANNMT